MLQIFSQNSQEEFNDRIYIDSGEYTLVLNEARDTILCLYEFTDLLCANILIADFKTDTPEVKGSKKKELELAKQIVEKHFPELLLV